jgi:hypothetical protein
MTQALAGRRSTGGVCLTLVAALVAATGGCGSGASPEHKAAISKIQELGAEVNFKRGGYEVVWSGDEITNDDLANLKKISNLKSVDLRGTPITDEGLVHVESITTLEFINVQRTSVTAEAADALRKKLPNTDVRR